MLRDNSYTLMSLGAVVSANSHFQPKLLSPGLMVSKRPERKLREEKEDSFMGSVRAEVG